MVDIRGKQILYFLALAFWLKHLLIIKDEIARAKVPYVAPDIDATAPSPG